MQHLLWAQARYLAMLNDRDTFSITTNQPFVVRGLLTLDQYRQTPEGGAPTFVSELLQHFNYNRFNCPYVFAILVQNPMDGFPGGGGRTLNTGWNSGAGMMMISSWNMDNSPNFQSTLRHELGHGFGLLHPDVYGYSMDTNASIMSYNVSQWTSWFVDSPTPGILIPEDLRILLHNKRVFPQLDFDPQTDSPSGYSISPNYVWLGAQTIPGQLDYSLQAVTSKGGSYANPPTVMLINHVEPSSGPGNTFDAANMWHSSYNSDGWAAVDITFPLPVSLDRIRLHSQHSGTTWMASKVRIQAFQGPTLVDVCSNALQQIDPFILFSRTTAQIWRLNVFNPDGYVVIRGLEFFDCGDDVFPPAVGPLDMPPPRTSTPQTQVFNPATSFTLTNGNPNGVWLYGWMPVGFGDLHQFLGFGLWNVGPGWFLGGPEIPVVWLNTNSSTLFGVPPGLLGLHPGANGEPAVLRWAPPVAGSAHITGQFLAGESGIEQVSVLENGAVLWSSMDSGSFDLITEVNPNGVIDFAVSGPSAGGDTPLAADITLTLSPYSLKVDRMGITNIVAFQAAAGSTYVLESASTLDAGHVWTTVSTNTASANEMLRFMDVSTSDTAYYRVRNY